ncbi:MAG: helicase-related protein [Patescibacteria group bacterium]
MLKLNFIDEEKIERREYQFADAEEIIEAGERGLNCGLVYPTGTGKTFTAFLAIDHYLTKGKVLFLAHTNPLCEQHCRDARFVFNLPADEIDKMVGRVSAKKRGDLWKRSKMIVATPQTIVGEIQKGTIDLSDVAFVLFDEMHMANKKYAYVEIAQQCSLRNIRVLGLTASSGNSDRIELLEKNYNLRWWIYRSSKDSEVKKFVFPKSEKIVLIDYSDEHLEAMSLLRRCILAVHNSFSKCKIVAPIQASADIERRLPFLRLTELNDIYVRVNQWVSDQKAKDKNSPWYDYVALYGAYYRLMHLLNLFVTENYEVTVQYIEDISKQLEWKNSHDPFAFPIYRKNPASMIWNNYDFQKFRQMVVQFVQEKKSHPKMERFLKLIEERLHEGNKVLVFSNFKSTLDVLFEKLKLIGTEARIVAGNEFMKAKEQQEVIRAFSAGDFPVLLATTVVEAGIHVPKIDAVINYSMPLTGIAQIQRGGRAGRTAVGLVYYLIMDNSNDSSLFFAARADNRFMDEELRRRLTIQRMEKAGEDVRILRAKQGPLDIPGFLSYDKKPLKPKSRGLIRSKPVVNQLDLFTNITPITDP